MTGVVATATASIEATPERVWTALTDADEVKAWFFGTDQRSEWTPGSPITWSGEWDGKAYQDKGVVVAVDRPHRLEVTHWSPLTGTEDAPENYHTLVYTLTDKDGTTALSVTQDNNGDQAEADRNAQTWSQMLASLKQHIESQ
jgi:uncharacterized protein YndB with AHSA1/START domain